MQTTGPREEIQHFVAGERNLEGKEMPREKGLERDVVSTRTLTHLNY